jgi:GTP cyclohydrolase IA
MPHRISDGISNLVDGIKSRICAADDDENFLDTPNRVERMYKEFVSSSQEIEDEINKIFSKRFPTPYNGQIIWPSIQSFSLCPHHLVPVEYSVTIGILPKQDEGIVLGLSKPIRLVRILARQPLLQETYTQNIANIFIKYLEPHGVAVITQGQHGCMKYRGVLHDKPVIMSVMMKEYRDNPTLRSEFFDLLKLYRQGKII